MSFTGMIQTIPVVGTKNIFIAFGPNRFSAISHQCAPYFRTNVSKVLDNTGYLYYHNVVMSIVF